MVIQKVHIQSYELSYIVVEKFQQNLLVFLSLHAFKLLVFIIYVIDWLEFPLSVFFTVLGFLPPELFYKIGRVIAHFLVRREEKLCNTYGWLLDVVNFLVVPEEAPYLQKILVLCIMQEDSNLLQLIDLSLIKPSFGNLPNRYYYCPEFVLLPSKVKYFPVTLTMNNVAHFKI